MTGAWSLLAVAAGYMAFLFAIALWGDRRADQGRSVVGHPLIYTLSLTVYCTAWTYFGSVGLAISNGLAFLPIYLGPTLAALLFPLVLHKVVRIAQANEITSIADMIGSRYGKSPTLAGLVTVIAVCGATPYIALQIKALVASVNALLGADATAGPLGGPGSALTIAMVLAAFAILFGTRTVDATESHQGMVLAIAVEGVVKLVAFVTVGAFVTFGLHDGFADLARKAIDAGFADRLTLAGSGLTYTDWFVLTLLAASTMFLLPRQFQVAVLENVDERHIRTASWAFPAYLLLINIFVLPIALAGLLAGSDAGDMMVLDLTSAAGHPWLATLAFLGGFSAATAMIVVATVALSTMISNDLVIPIVLRNRLLRRGDLSDLSWLILLVRRVSIVLLMLLGYLFFMVLGGRFQLAGIGLIAFAAVAQFGPAFFAGLYWRGANRKGALTGMIAGVIVWFITLIVPALVDAGLLGAWLLTDGLFGSELLRPQALLGTAGMHPVVHALLWSLSINTALLVLVSLLTGQDGLERLQAFTFTDGNQDIRGLTLWRGETAVAELCGLMRRFVGQDGLDRFLQTETARRGHDLAAEDMADADFVRGVELRLASAIGASSARAVVSSVVRGEVIGPEDVMGILEETSQVVRYSHQLEEESRALALATEELRDANRRLQQLDKMKDDFIATVSHELRTPLTSIRSFSEILLDAPDLDENERAHFLGIVVRESERLTRLINDVLDLSKIESGKMEWLVEPIDLREVVDEAIAATSGLFAEREIAISFTPPPQPAVLPTDRDRMVQVVVNLLSNAAKFVPAAAGRVEVSIDRRADCVEVCVTDNGPGIPEQYRQLIFDKFHQASEDLKGRPRGTGLGLTICREIVEYFGGRIWAEDASSGGAALRFVLPTATG